MSTLASIFRGMMMNSILRLLFEQTPNIDVILMRSNLQDFAPKIDCMVLPNLGSLDFIAFGA